MEGVIRKSQSLLHQVNPPNWQDICHRALPGQSQSLLHQVNLSNIICRMPLNKSFSRNPFFIRSISPTRGTNFYVREMVWKSQSLLHQVNLSNTENKIVHGFK